MARFRKKPLIIDAVRLKVAVTVDTQRGILKGQPGDWLITAIAGPRSLCADVLFRACYDPVNDEARKMMMKED